MIAKSGDLPAADAGQMGPHNVGQGVQSFKGVAVTATNNDDIAAVGVSLGFAAGAAISLSGSINVDTINTSATIGKHAAANCGPSCPTHVSGANVAQSVAVIAANQFRYLGIAASISGGVVAVGAGVAARVVTPIPAPLIGDNATGNARNNNPPGATAQETSPPAAAAGP